jgi:hypothetical protein
MAHRVEYTTQTRKLKCYFMLSAWHHDFVHEFCENYVVFET